MTDSVEHHLTRDGSSTLYSRQFNQFYHNPNGAITESLHVFFETPGLLALLESGTDTLTIFETGFGTGLNFLILLNEYLKRELDFSLNFYSAEAFPVDSSTIKKTNYVHQLGNKKLLNIQKDVFTDLKKGWNSINPLSGKPVTLNLFIGRFNEINEIDNRADFIFHDPFSPEVNQELWTTETFLKLRSFAHPDTVLSTYCAASKARACMAKAGWYLARAKGALGKREMTLASPDQEKLSGFKRVNEERLIQRLDEGDF